MWFFVNQVFLQTFSCPRFFSSELDQSYQSLGFQSQAAIWGHRKKALPAVPKRKAAKKYPWYIGLGLLFLTVILRLSNITDESVVTIRTPDRLLCIYIFGWCLCFAKTRLQKIVMVLLTLTVFPYLYGIYASYTIWLVLGTLAMMWKPKILMPQLLHTPVTQIGTSTFYIYLTHIIPIHFLVHYANYHNVTIIILISLVLGVLVNKGLTKIKL